MSVKKSEYLIEFTDDLCNIISEQTIKATSKKEAEYRAEDIVLLKGYDDYIVSEVDKKR